MNLKIVVRMTVVAALAAMLGAQLGRAADGVGGSFPSVARILTQSLDDQPGHEVRMDIVTFPPGAKSPDHRHPGHVFVYVLEGEIETRVGDGKVTRYKEGDSFYEPKNAIHADSRNPSDSTTARILAVMIAPEGEASLRLSH
jgi:quercetin dioxygenase-like cupin family protein